MGNEIHRSFSQFTTQYENLSSKRKYLFYKSSNWKLFKHFETQKIYAEYVAENNKCGWTALHQAVALNDVEIARALIVAGVDIDEQTNTDALVQSMQAKTGWLHMGDHTALHQAAWFNRLEIGRLLVDAGANFNKKWDWGSAYVNEDLTALQIAFNRNNGEFAEMLLKKMTKFV